MFARHKYKDYFLKGSLRGSTGCVGGWTNGNTFLETLKYFQKFFKSSKNHPVLIILDNHESHITLDTIL